MVQINMYRIWGAYYKHTYKLGGGGGGWVLNQIITMVTKTPTPQIEISVFVFPNFFCT